MNEKQSLVSLSNRLKEVDKQIKNLVDEYNNIILELWERIPTLKDEKEFQQKELKKKLTSDYIDNHNVEV